MVSIDKTIVGRDMEIQSTVWKLTLPQHSQEFDWIRNPVRAVEPVPNCVCSETSRFLERRSGLALMTADGTKVVITTTFKPVPLIP